MSAIIDPYRNMDFDSLRRYTTKTKILIHSHNHPDPIEVSDDVISVVCGKTIKGIGKANLTLTPRQNYINMIFPDDYINIYFDTGDGSGWVRTFFGLVDRVEEKYEVNDAGVPGTLYTIVASDFSKAVNKTQVYFNPTLVGRQDVGNEDYAQSNIGGMALYTRGLFAAGSPADCVLNVLMVMMGFGSQWKLPESYPGNIPERFVGQRLKYVTDTLLNTVQPELADRLREIVEGSGLDAFRRSESGEVLNALEDNAGDDLSSEDVETRVKIALLAAGVERDELSRTELAALRQETSPERMAEILANPRIRRQLNAPVDAQVNIDRLAAAERAVAQGRTILDITNVFDFVERLAIDGYSFQMAIWERQGPLWNIVKSVSNEMVNELFFDLRPMTIPVESNGEVHISSGTSWDYSPDELGGNVATEDDGVTAPGIRYMPALIMREYPFSTVREVDAANIDLRLKGKDNRTENLGRVYFGGVFSSSPNTPGRHFVKSPILHVVEQQERQNEFTYKHLDVAVISETEIRSSTLGRSDADHFNLFEMYTDSELGADMRFLMFDFLPVITPVHIMRHGLRARTVSTRFARFPPTAQPVPVQLQEEQEEAEEAEEEEPTLSTEVIPPVAAHPSLIFRNRNGSNYGYRVRPPNPAIGVNEYVYRFHNGIDIAGHGPGHIGISASRQRDGDVAGPVDVVAIADGYVVASAHTGTFNGYGNVVVLHHPQFQSPSGGPVFSAYTHLADRDPITGNQSNSRSRRRCCNGEYIARGGDSFEYKFIPRGTRLGSIGKTAGRNGGNQLFTSSGPHLHFEIDYKFPPINPAATPTVPVPEATSRPDGTNPNNTDPVAWFAEQGVDLVAEIRRLAGAENPDDDISEEDDDAVDSDEEAVGESPATAQLEDDEVDQAQQAANSNTAPRAKVDSASIRRQIGRWAFLQDHWYQHNLEYLSGTIVMRPAPEIRVGYRLDILERNMSFYVEGVQHTWNYSNELVTTLQVTRGQPNNPFPAYAKPPLAGFNMPPDARKSNSRLAQYFIVPDPIAVRRAISVRSKRVANAITHDNAFGNDGINRVDKPDLLDNYSEGREGLVSASSEEFDGFAEPEPTLENAEELSKAMEAVVATDSGAVAPDGGKGSGPVGGKK